MRRQNNYITCHCRNKRELEVTEKHAVILQQNERQCIKKHEEIGQGRTEGDYVSDTRKYDQGNRET